MTLFVLATWFVLVSVMFLCARADNARVPFTCVVYRKLTIRVCAYFGSIVAKWISKRNPSATHLYYEKHRWPRRPSFLPSFWGIPKAVC